MPHVFDVYGTLLDVDAAAREAAAAPGMDALASSWSQLAAAWRQRQLSYSWLRTTMQRYTDFWTVTQNALDVTMAEMGIEDAAMRETLLSLYTTLSAYDEVPAVLRDLAARGEGTGVLSNGSPAMLDSALDAAGIADSLDQVLSVDSLRLYKPDPAVYRLVTDAFVTAARSPSIPRITGMWPGPAVSGSVPSGSTAPASHGMIFPNRQRIRCPALPRRCACSRQFVLNRYRNERVRR